MTFDGTAILTAVRDVLTAEHGDANTIAASTYLGDLHELVTLGAQSLRALEAPRVEARITRQKRAKQTPPDPGDVTLVDVEVEVTVVRAITGDELTRDSIRRLQRAQATRDGDVLSQAFESPRNLAQTAAGAPTGLVSGVLRHRQSAVGKITWATAARTGAVIDTRHAFDGVVRVAS